MQGGQTSQRQPRFSRNVANTKNVTHFWRIPQNFKNKEPFENTEKVLKFYKECYAIKRIKRGPLQYAMVQGVFGAANRTRLHFSLSRNKLKHFASSFVVMTTWLV